ncbi:hypothetical protein Tco_0740372 [Tanacetum coccineum]
MISKYLDKTIKYANPRASIEFTIRQVPRGDNKKADALSKIASTSFAHLSKQVLVEILKNKSISEMGISTVIEEQDPTWMTPIIEFISKGHVSLHNKRMPVNGYAASDRRDFEQFRNVSSIDVRSYNHGSPMRRTYSGRLCAPRDSCGFMQYALQTRLSSKSLTTVWVLLPSQCTATAATDKEMALDCQ